MKIFTEPVAIAMVIAGLVLFMAVPVFFLWNEVSNLSTSKTINAEKISSYGSLTSGLVGTIWSLASVVLFYVALREQRKDMEVNKDALKIQTDALTQQVHEFELQRMELEETRKVYIEQSKTQSVQRFENTFFNMLNQHDRIVNTMSINNKVGRAAFKEHHFSIQHAFKSTNVNTPSSIKQCYSKYFQGQQEAFNHYFNNFHHIVILIDKTDIADKEFYANLLAAQLSAHELSVIFYYGLTSVGNKLKPLLERYQLFTGINPGNIHPNTSKSDIIHMYESRAYGKKDYSFVV